MSLSIQEVAKKYKQHPHYAEIESLLRTESRPRLFLQGLAGSSKSLLFSQLLAKTGKLHFFILEDKDEAAYLYNDLQQCLTDKQVLFFPSSYKRNAHYGHTDQGNIILRTHVLNRLSDYKQELLVLVTYIEAISEKVISRKKLAGDTLQLIKGEKVSIEFIREMLDTYQFENVDFVYEPGQYAVRGSIVDIFSFTSDMPYRVDFFGNEVETIRSFEVDTQLSNKQFDRISILPNILNYASSEIRQSVFGFEGSSPTIWSGSLQFIAEKLGEAESTDEIFGKADFMAMLSGSGTVEFGTKTLFKDAKPFQFQTKPQPQFQKNFKLLGDDLLAHRKAKADCYILSDNEKQLDRLRDIFKDTHNGIDFIGIPQVLHEGFTDTDLAICCYTDHQIFDRYHKYRINQFFSSKAAVSLKELKDLKPGDYIVHIDHGIGRFGGLEQTVVNGKKQEAIRLVYRDNDVLYVSIHALHRISKYKGKDDDEPKIYKLGSGAWQKLKQTTKKKVKDIARDLIALYAQRKAQEGFRYSVDTYLQEELEASFIYEDTPDQEKATRAVKSDMEGSIPMDRLICGDVGFGKTEIAVRAAFKAVADSKQVAILVPTTILAMQHHATFRDRLKDFPCTVESISRLKKASDQKLVLKGVEEGKVDILIGTHRLLGSDIKFKDLGLLIIDEEQKFGVAAKEKLRSLKVNVDTLTLTATPIPRTLQFSLLGARDLSVINTPPPNRHPIITEVHNFSEQIIQEGIQFEIERGGQVFFIHNRVQNIYEVEALIKKLCPKVRTIVGHGQLDGPQLEGIMTGFISGDYDVLVATSIIESGLDIPNANTIFIHNAQNFGLSDLHQLRGRVGRSNKKAFCYLLAPPLTTLTTEARRRLKAIEEFSDLGSGLSISLQDLDIRGAGNMLGAEQSGFIADIGYETYNRILNEAMQELKDEEFKGLFDDPKKDTEEEPEDVKYTADCTIDTDLEIHIPERYVTNVTERIRLYRQLDGYEQDADLEIFRTELADRFGPVPKPVEELMRVVKLRWLAQSLGFEKLIIKNNRMVGYFVSDPKSAFYSSPTFRKVLEFVQKSPRRFQMKEAGNKLSLTFENVSTIEQIHSLMSEIKNPSPK